MLLGERDEVGARPRDRDERPRVGLEERPLALERRVARAAGDRAVQGGVGQRLRVRVAGPGGGEHRRVAVVELVQLRVGHRRARQLGGERLQRRAHRERLDELVGAERAHAAAPVRLVAHAADVLEVAQRLAHGRLRDAQLLGDPRLDEPRAGGVLARHDALQHHVLDPLAQAAPRQRIRGGDTRLHHGKSIIPDGVEVCNHARHGPAAAGTCRDRACGARSGSGGGSRSRPPPSSAPPRRRRRARRCTRARAGRPRRRRSARSRSRRSRGP